ncbi:integrin alpha-PS3-like [Epargyreus clarus]|uniref:integrin alpha-PS3-like n=1 Tax=Epargyreus clarus TaxID=520877 RepID=UPI003C2D5621
MCKTVLLCCVLVLNIISNDSLGIFHEKSKIIFRPDDVADYFGYSVLLNKSGMYVGAPKARSRLNRSISPGLVFFCPLDNLDSSNVTCTPLGTDIGVSRFASRADFLKDDMWFGAVIAAMPTGNLLICAPRWTTPYKDTHLLANGACYFHGQKRGQWLLPLQDMNRQAYMVDGTRKEYGEYGLHLNFYAYGQAGMSAKVTDSNTVIIGAPGLLQWTGGISEYMLYPDYSAQSVRFGIRSTTNPYKTKEVGPDDYLGYSVESGAFDDSGKTFYVAGAPRSKAGYGQVLIFEQSFRDTEPLDIKAKVHGPHLGSYFGASVACFDVNGDSVVDLLVGAPSYVKKGGGLPYDQGAVFVYLTERQDTSFILKDAGFVTGSRESGARFGTAIAELGDIDGDGYKDVAIGAPWENEGMGAVYIYLGSPTGLKPEYVQRIIAEDAKSFGIAISKAVDIDSNNCNDLAIGAYKSSTAYIYRCIPTMQVSTAIKVPDAMYLPQNTTNFTALFCVDAPAKKMWPHVKIDLTAKITVDREGNRARISGDSEYNVSLKPGNDACEEQIVEVMPTADLSKPISIQFTLTPKELMQDSSLFLMNAARLSENSILHSFFDIQLTRDCGADLICRPLLVMTLEPLVNPYIPGSDDKLGFKVKVLNKEEPAYGAKVFIELPSNPIRLPSACTLEGLNVTCNVPSPLLRGESVLWEIEMEFTLKGILEKQLTISARLKDPFHNINVTKIDQLHIRVTPKANFGVSGKALPNTTIAVTREKLNAAGSINLVHYYEVTNFGPSDWYRLEAQIALPDQVNISSPIKGCVGEYGLIECVWPLPAKVSMPIIVPLRFDLGIHKSILEENTQVNITSNITLLLGDKFQSISTTTTLVLDPSQPLWPLIVGLIAGFTLLAAIVFALYKYGFFSRTSRDELKKLQEQSLILEESSPSSADLNSSDADDSTRELVDDSN